MMTNSEFVDEIVFLNDLVADVLEHVSVRGRFIDGEHVERPIVQILRMYHTISSPMGNGTGRGTTT